MMPERAPRCSSGRWPSENQLFIGFPVTWKTQQRRWKAENKHIFCEREFAREFPRKSQQVNMKARKASKSQKRSASKRKKRPASQRQHGGIRRKQLKRSVKKDVAKILHSTAIHLPEPEEWSLEPPTKRPATNNIIGSHLKAIVQATEAIENFAAHLDLMNAEGERIQERIRRRDEAQTKEKAKEGSKEGAKKQAKQATETTKGRWSKMCTLI